MPLDCLGPLRGLHHPWPVLGALQCARRAQGFRMPLDCLGPLRGVHHPWPVLDALHVCAMCAWDTCPWTVLGLCVCGASPLAGLGRSAFWYACMCGCFLWDCVWHCFLPLQYASRMPLAVLGLCVGCHPWHILGILRSCVWAGWAY